VSARLHRDRRSRFQRELGDALGAALVTAWLLRRLLRGLRVSR